MRQQTMYMETLWSESILTKAEAKPGQERLGTTGGMGSPSSPIRLTAGVPHESSVPQKCLSRDLHSSPLPLKEDFFWFDRKGENNTSLKQEMESAIYAEMDLLPNKDV